MLRILLKLIVLSLFFGCEVTNQKELEFENSLPKMDLATIEEMVNVYDNLVESKYNGNPNQLFLEIANDQTIFNKSYAEKYCKLVKKFDNSTLEFKTKKASYDSVYLTTDGTIVKLKKDQEQGKDDLVLEEDILLIPQWSTMEEEIQEIKDNGYHEFVSESSFLNALRKIADGNEDVLGFIDRKEMVGYLSPKRLAIGLLEYDLDLNDYFIKRIIVFELFTNQLKIEFGC